MDVLCFDISSGGISAARFDESLKAGATAEVSWQLQPSAAGRALLHAADIEAAFRTVAHTVRAHEPLAAVSIACFMHSFVIVEQDGTPGTAVFTWLDTADRGGINRIRAQFGDDFHKRTGCHYHPMFPVFKLVSMPVAPSQRVLSPRTMLTEALTGLAVEDYGMAGASGLLNVLDGRWDEEILRAAGLRPSNLPSLGNRDERLGEVTSHGASRFGIRQGTPVVNGSGDGFLANVGSGAETSRRMAVTIGTSASARQALESAVLDPSAGTFCYRATSDAFLLGCAGSNGGNALDWARRVFDVGRVTEPSAAKDIPIFLPWLNGERSLEWNSELRASWHGVSSLHTERELFHAVVEAVVFNLANYVEVIESRSGIRPDQIVLSGNGFLDPQIPPLLAALVRSETLQPPEPGLASLRGAAICAWRALGHDPQDAVAKLLGTGKPVLPLSDDRILDRYSRFKMLRKTLSCP